MRIFILLFLLSCSTKAPAPAKVEIVAPKNPAPKVGEIRSVDFFGAKKKYKVKSVCVNPKGADNSSLVVKLKPLNGKGSEIQAYEDGDPVGLATCP